MSSATAPAPRITTLSRQRYAQIVSAIQARFSLALAPDARFQFTQPVDPPCAAHSNEQQAWALAVVKFGRKDNPIEFAHQVGDADAVGAPVVQGGYIRLKLRIPEGQFLVKILSTHTP